MTFPKKHRPGSLWRFLAHERVGKGYGAEIELKRDDKPTEFDELVVDDWLHVEQLDSCTWWMRVGPLVLHVSVGERGQAREVSVVEEDFGFDLNEHPTGEMVWTKADP